MTSPSNPAKVVLGDEYDEKVRRALRDSLREFGAQAVDHWWGVGGSQEIEVLEVEIAGESIRVESETYIGLSIAGTEQVVNQIAARVRQRMSARG